MKKLFILAAMMTATVAANAQYTPEAGKVSTEVQFNPFGQDYNQFKIDGLKVRYFITENQAVRLNLNFGLENSKQGEANKDKGLSKTTTKGTTFGIGAGYEFHFAQTERYSVYAGVGVGFETYSFKNKSEGAVEGELKNCSGIREVADGVYEVTGANAYNAINAKLFTGIDVYLWKGLFVGAELGFGFENKSYKNPEMKSSTETTKVELKKSETKLGFEIEPAVRLGWTF